MTVGWVAVFAADDGVGVVPMPFPWAPAFAGATVVGMTGVWPGMMGLRGAR